MRSALKAIHPVGRDLSPHVGLVFDQGLRSFDPQDSDAKRDLVRQVSNYQTPIVYKSFLRRWQQAIGALPEAEVRPAHCLQRVVVGLGGDAVLETGFSFHRTYGVPFLAGSALKGLASSYAHQRLESPEWRIDGAAYRTMFGDTESAGYVMFHDALPWMALKDPVTNKTPEIEAPFAELKLHPDVMTVHHARYYMQGDVPPADWDSPTPVPFLTASGTFLVALSGPAEWRAKAFEILTLALAEYGVGAKTASGYGRFKLAR